MDKGWIKIHRSLLDWEWYEDDEAVKMLIHLNLKVNIKDKMWKGQLIKAGSIALSWNTLSESIGYSIQKCRTIIRKLEYSNEITRFVTSKYQVVTLVKWGQMQFKENESTSSSTDEQQANNKPTTTTKEDNNKRINIKSNIPMSEIKISDVDDKLKFYFEVAEKFRLLFIQNLEDKNTPTKHQKVGTFKNYVNPIRLMIEKDEVTREQLLKVYGFLKGKESERDGFSWKANILSTSKLRDKFQILSTKANIKSKTTSKNQKGANR